MSAPYRNRVRRNQFFMVLVLVLILIAIGMLYGQMRNIAAVRQAQHKHSFYEYVAQHRIGSLQEIDDGTGLNPMSYVLTINHHIPDSDAKQFVRNLIKQYVAFDHGATLTIVYQDPKTKKTLPFADANFNDDKHELTLTVTFASGVSKRYGEHVNW